MARIQMMPADFNELKPVRLFEEAVAACLASHMDRWFEAEVSVSGGQVIIECSWQDQETMRSVAQNCTLLKMFSIPYTVTKWR